ncbi:MAG: guanylate kinase [Microscillaceae bacterium]|jgi:guanylate kinase|nr:guanylate kinase [Microscillaceae bacterium]
MIAVLEKPETRPITPLSPSGKILIFSAPSGSGKTTIVRHLLQNNPNLGFSVSACTRARRAHEQDGKDYYFLTLEEFRTKIAQQAFVEWEEVYANSFYGTLKSEIERIWAQGKHVIFDVEVHGGLNLKKYFGDQALAVFVTVPSLEILEARLRSRQTESEESLQKRIAKFQYELTFRDKFDAILLNENLEEALLKAQELVSEFVNK